MSSNLNLRFLKIIRTVLPDREGGLWPLLPTSSTAVERTLPPAGEEGSIFPMTIINDIA